MPVKDLEGRPGAIPGLGPPAETNPQWAVPIPYAGLSIIAEKVGRGCEYRFENRQRLVKPPYGIRTLIRASDFVPEPFGSACKLLDFGPGCKIRRLKFIEDDNMVWYFITIWNALNFHVRIELERELLKAEEAFQKNDGLRPEDIRGMQISPYLRTLNR